MSDGYEVAVFKGSILLDKEKPGWWEEGEINLSTLDQLSKKDSIIGQLYGDYNNGKETLGLTYEEAVSCGFQVPMLRGFFVERRCQRKSKKLTQAWIVVVEYRRWKATAA